ncbi:N-acetylneuraminate synthase family protein [Candidatus Babeliales bacterium]|nr:N-acetylneuraminate synthase family protein [Candidatus Babeliales bacterium]
MKYSTSFLLNGREISIDSPTYFIADIASNHDGDLNKAKDLIWLAKESGADAAKFQHFKAETFVSEVGSQNLGKKLSHQSKWKKSIFEVHKDAECKREWSEELYKTAKEANIDFFTTPYDYEAIELLDPYICAYKIGSGDINWIDFIQAMAKKNKPIFLATGASIIEEVERAVEALLKCNDKLVLMQCNTNYTGSLDNFKHINLRVLQTYALRFPQMILGLSDHTPHHATVLGAIAMGARVVEKHFTNDNALEGPDHFFAMNPKSWREMIDRSRELEAALGDGIKRIEQNEKEPIIVQRRSIRLNKDIGSGHFISEKDLICLRPAPENSISPSDLNKVLGRSLKKSKKSGEHITLDDF